MLNCLLLDIIFKSCVEPEWYLASDSIEKLQSLSNIAYGRNSIRKQFPNNIAPFSTTLS